MKEIEHMNTEDFLHDYLKNLKPKLRFIETITKDQFFVWQEKVRAKLVDLMKFPGFDIKMPEPELLWSKERDGYTLQKWLTRPEQGSIVPFLMLIPNTGIRTKRFPAILCFPGSGHTKESLAGEPEEYLDIPNTKMPFNNQQAKHYVEQGFVAIAVENPGTGELKQADLACNREFFSTEILYYGRNYLGISVYQKMKILEWIKSLDFIDTDKIALSGHSLGTEPAMVIGVLDLQIKAVIHNDCIADNRIRRIVVKSPERQGSWHLVPDMFEWFTFPDLYAAFAPRHLLITEGGVMSDLTKIRSAYKLFEYEENLEIHFYPKYSKPEQREFDFVKIPEGITEREWMEYANCGETDGVISHYFKEKLAIPWIKKVFDI